MAIDPLSPIAPARIRALLLPVGRIKRSRFLAFVDLVQSQCLVRLGDISPDPRPDRNMFSPLAFPSGTLLYDFSTSLPPSSHVALSPFEQFREPFLVIGIADAAEYQWPEEESRATETDATLLRTGRADVTEFQSTVDELAEQYPKACLHSLMFFDYRLSQRPSQLPQDTILVPPISRLRTTTMKTIICDLTSKLLAEITTLARSIQALPTVPSPASNQTGTMDGHSAWSATESLGTQLGRRNSQIVSLSRPESPNLSSQKDLHRMSMPVLPSNSTNSAVLEDPRATSPASQGARTPPTTFDDIAGVNAPDAPGRTNTSSSRQTSSKNRDSSADRVSIHGFGSGGVGERARNKGRGRISIVIGTLYMGAGQWHDAIRELTEGATRARAFSDHLWHAKALENILVCLLLFSWAGMDFQIPQLCYPITDKSSSTKSPQHTPSASVADVASTIPASHEVALENLNTLIPDLINMILSIYNRASNFAGESLPPLAFCECVIRFSKLLAAMNLSAGSLDFDALQHLVQNTPLRQKPRLSVPRLSVNPTRNDIASLLFRALPAQSEASGISPTDRVVVLAGVASILSYLGLQRKKAIVMKEFITSLIPGLVQARKVGAAEMGVHPAAGLAALNMASTGAAGAGALNLGEGEMENGIDEFLGLLGRIYGIPDTRASLIPGTPFAQNGDTTQSIPSGAASHKVVEEILRVSSLRSFGSLSLKLDILRLCIHFCEALPDFNGVIHFTALLLRMAGPGTAPKANSTDVFVSLAREEQVRLYANISKTVAASKKLGIQHTETEYWDDFLVRGIFITEEAALLRLTQHRPAELQAASSAKEGPFIHNPWIKQPNTSSTERVLVANEEYHFVIALQNPYDFELEIASLRIAADGVDLFAHEEHFILGPYRTQKFPIGAIPRSAGDLVITGCYIKVTGCRERLFPIFPDPWKPEKEAKMKKIGLTACLGAPISRPSSAVAPSPGIDSGVPVPQSLAFTVIPDQPIVNVSNVSLPQGSIMVLEGERKRFRIDLFNTSSTTAVDFVHVSFQDSASSAVQANISNKDIPPAELHESEVQLAKFPSLRWCKNEDEDNIRIAPGATLSFEIEVIGRARLTDAIVQFDYANLGKRRSEVEDRFFTRQVSVPISITVNASVQLHRPDIVPLSGDFAWPSATITHKQASSTSEVDWSSSGSILVSNENSKVQDFVRNRQQRGHGDEYCMLLLDLRNSWPNPLYVTLQARGQLSQEDESQDLWNDSYTVNEIIQPGHVSRVVVVLPKVYIGSPYAAIPSLNPANQRQFVVSASKISPEVERTSREAFWYRQELLKLVRGTWKEDGNGRHGEIELRSIRFSPRMVEAFKLDDIKIGTEVVPGVSTAIGTNVKQIGRAKYHMEVDEFVLFKTTIHNRSPNPISPLLRLQPYLSGLPHNVALDLDKRISWTGILQRKLPVISPGQSTDAELGLIALCSGIFEVGVTVDEAELMGSGDKKDGNRARSGTANLLQADVIGEPKLRSWHLKEPCIIIARRTPAAF